MTSNDSYRVTAREAAGVGTAAGLLVGACAAWLRAPGVLYADAGELLTAVALKGVAHPPGFPLYLLLGGLWLDATRFFHATPASRLNLFSSVADGVASAAIAIAALALFARVRLNLSPFARRSLACLAGLLAGFGPTLFDFSLGIEVYALHAVFLSLAFGSALAAGGEEKPATKLWLSAAAGIAAGGGLAVHHATMVVILPGLALLLWSDDGAEARWRRCRAFLLGLIPGLLTYVLLPLRAVQNPPLNWGNPSTLFRFWIHISAHDYQVNIENSLSTILQHAGRFLEAYLAEFSPAGLALAAAGAFLFFRKGKWAGAGLLLAVAGDIAFAVRYEIAEDQAAYYIPTFLATSLLAVLGAGWILSRLSQRGERAAKAGVAAALLAAAALVSSNVRGHAGRARDGRAIESAENFLASLPKGSLVFTPEWNLYSPVLSSIEVEGKRSDVLALDILLLRRGWYLDAFARRHPARYAEVKGAFDAYRAALADWEEQRPYDGDRLTKLYDTLTHSLARSAWSRGATVSWIGTVLAEHLPPGAALVPCGLAYRVLPTREQSAVRLEDAPLQFREALGKDLPREDVFELKIRPLYVGMLVQRALYEEAFGRRAEAEARLAIARVLNPSDPQALEVAADLLVAGKRPSEALELYAQALRNGGDGARIGEKSRAALAATKITTPKIP